jgi:hypothetical protein
MTYYGGNLESLTTKILDIVHDNPIVGHSGYQKTLHQAKQDVYWRSMRSDFKHYIRNCDMFQ